MPRVKLLTPNRGAEVEVDEGQARELIARGFHRVDGLAASVPEVRPAGVETAPTFAPDPDTNEPETPEDTPSEDDESPTTRFGKRNRK